MSAPAVDSDGVPAGQGWQLRRWLHGRLACLCLSVLWLASGEQPAVQAAPPVWGMRTGDSFVVDVVIDRQTTLRLGTAEPTTQRSVDRLELDYRVEGAAPDGTLYVRVRFRGALRDAENGERSSSLLADQRLGLLEGVELVLEIAADGIVEQISPSDRTALINNLTGLNAATAAVLDECCSEDALKAWLGRPLWFARDQRTLQPGQSWDCREQISLGLLGSLRTSVRVMVPEVASADSDAAADPDADSAVPAASDPDSQQLTLTGAGRFVPSGLVGSRAAAASGLPLQIIRADATLDAYSGTAVLSSAAPPGSLGATRRPQFEQLELQLQLHGTCQVAIGSTTRDVEFQQQQSQTWNLRSWRMGGPFPMGAPDFQMPLQEPAEPEPK